MQWPALGREALAGEGAKDAVAAVGTVYAGDSLSPISAKEESRGGAGYEGKAELSESAGIAFLVDGLEGGEAPAEQPAKRVLTARPIDGFITKSGVGYACRLHME